jgi:dephospho-CoA kinase
MKTIGLTGPIAAGKNEVARILKRLKIAVIDVDKLAHTLYYPQSPIWRDLLKVFGSRILKRGGEINRKKLGEMVFADKKKMIELNDIVHPYLRGEVINRVEELISAGEKRIVINAAVLKEIGLVNQVDKVWVVVASKENRLQRLIKKGLSKEQALKRINAQVSQNDYLKIADLVIKNDGSLKELDEKVRAGIKL